MQKEPAFHLPHTCTETTMWAMKLLLRRQKEVGRLYPVRNELTSGALAETKNGCRLGLDRRAGQGTGSRL